MAYKVFIDINIIVDFLQPVRTYHKDAVDLFFELSKNTFTAFITESIITTTVYLIEKDYTLPELHSLLYNLNHKLKILPCTNNLVISTLQKQPPDFEDALLYQIALHHQMDYFVTSNIKDFKKIQQPALPVIRARELNKILTS